jgi:uncharacterized flavoprotein (TIGR03862 family)
MKKSVSIIGGGPSALLCAAFLDEKKYEITIFDQKKAFGRKFLVAGKGGFNLTHSEPIENFIKRYTPSEFLNDALLNFTNQDFREWLNSIGIPTVIGSSKRVYSENEVKPVEVLDAIIGTLENKGVQFKYDHQWSDWNDNQELVFQNGEVVKSDFVIFSMGGKSWEVTGSDGAWLNKFEKKSIETKPFESSNCAFKLNWPAEFIESHEGTPLKNIAIRCNKRIQKGEVVITSFGLEGNGIYALSPEIRHQLKESGQASIYIDLKPTIEEKDLLTKLQKSKRFKSTEILKMDVNMNRTHRAFLKSHVGKSVFMDKKLLAKNIKNLELKVLAAAPIEEAISSVGGISLSAIDTNFQLRDSPSSFCIGEMLDWDAPTGGYLIQGCVSMGVHVARHLNNQA